MEFLTDSSDFYIFSQLVYKMITKGTKKEKTGNLCIPLLLVHHVCAILNGYEYIRK